MAKRYAVVLSDIHIGNNAPTCWYQSSVHEPYLAAALRWIVAKRSLVQEVIFLGDMFDQWTYPPSMRPPSMSEIIAANRGLLGPSGPLASLVKGLPGQVRLLLGNHDGTLTAADIDTLNRSIGANPSAGERIELVSAPWRIIGGASRARTVVSHGHHWCMFNAPDPRSRWSTLPIGHFVSRAIAHNLSRRLAPGQTAADLPGSGNPYGPHAAAAVSAWDRRDDLAAAFLTYFCRSLGLPTTERIIRPDGSTSTCVEAMRIFAGLFTYWVKKERRVADAFRAAAADYRGDDLAWFAQRLALQTASDLTVMGHTHKPVGGLKVSPVDYVNSGYQCVAKPDMPAKRFTMTVVDLDHAKAELFTVLGPAAGYRVVPTSASPMDSVILSPFKDFSCYIGIGNRGRRPLRLAKAAKDVDSYWVVPPPDVIPPKTRVGIWLQDTLGTKGSSGSFTYTDGSRRLDFAVACPTLSPNAVSSPVPNYSTKTGDTRGWRTGGVDRLGHPLQARFPVDAAPAPVGAPAGPSRAQQQQPDLSGSEGVAPTHEFPEIVAARAVLARARAPRWRGEVLCLARLRSADGKPLLDPTTEPSRTGERLKNPPAHLSSLDVQSIELADGTRLRYVWIKPNVSVSYAGGLAFLPDPGSPTLVLVTLNVSRMDSGFKTSCDNAHHAEMQLADLHGFIDQQPAAWRSRLGTIALHNRSRRGPAWGYSPCNACCADLAAFLQRLNSLSRRNPVKASLSWERLYEGRRDCNHPTDAAHIRKLVASGWDEPMGPRPAGTTWPTPTPAPQAAPAPSPARPYGAPIVT